jgi:hypothetical protein
MARATSNKEQHRRRTCSSRSWWPSATPAAAATCSAAAAAWPAASRDSAVWRWKNTAHSDSARLSAAAGSPAESLHTSRPLL